MTLQPRPPPSGQASKTRSASSISASPPGTTSATPLRRRRDSKTIPPLGERSAEAIKAGHGAIEVIDETVRDLYRLRKADHRRALLSDFHAGQEVVALIHGLRVALYGSDGRLLRPAGPNAPAGAVGPSLQISEDGLV